MADSSPVVRSAGAAGLPTAPRVTSRWAVNRSKSYAWSSRLAKTAP